MGAAADCFCAYLAGHGQLGGKLRDVVRTLPDRDGGLAIEVLERYRRQELLRAPHHH